MKLKAIAAVCALAFAGQAFAAGPTASAAAGSAVSLYISGASALQGTIGQIANGLFTTGSISVFYDGAATATGSSGKNYRAYAGTLNSTAGAAAGKTAVIYNTAAGGSIKGVVNVALATPVTRILLADATCVLQTATDSVIAGAPLYSCTGTDATAIPDAGVSDTEPALFVGVNVPAGTPSATPAVVNALTAVSSLAQPMSIVVTLNSGITNLTKPQVTALLDATTTDWSWVDASLAAGPVVVCRRVAGSGTQAAINDFFFGFPCSVTQQAPAVAQVLANGGTAGGNYVVVENASAGAVATCMTAAQQGTLTGYTIDITSGAITTAAADATHVVLPAGGRAIGLVGLDRPASTVLYTGINGFVAGTKLPELYAPISINGVAPTVNNAATGAYDVVVNNSWNKRTNTVNGIAPLAGDQLAVFDAFVAKSGDKAILGTSKAPKVPGVLALADAVNLNFDPALNADGTLTNPVMRTAKSTSCQPPKQVQ
jgi:ABC-type phosphate transport system substrate-binding protein